MPNNLKESFTGKSVLIIEDDLEISRTLEELLLYEGFVVLTAGNGKEGLDHLKTPPHPGLIILDVMMPVMSGAEFLNIIVSDAILSTIPVYIHSATSSHHEFKGARGSIRKPANVDDILNIVHKYCSQLD